MESGINKFKNSSAINQEGGNLGFSHDKEEDINDEMANMK